MNTTNVARLKITIEKAYEGYMADTLDRRYAVLEDAALSTVSTESNTHPCSGVSQRKLKYACYSPLASLLYLANFPCPVNEQVYVLTGTCIVRLSGVLFSCVFFVCLFFIVE